MPTSLIFGMVLVLLSCLAGCRNSENAAVLPAASALEPWNSKFHDPSTKQLRDLLRQCTADEHNMQHRYGAVSDRSLVQVLGRPFWGGVFPIHYAKAKLLTQGRAAVAELLTMVTDPDMSKDDRAAAWMMIGDLNGLDEPGALAQLLEQYRRDQVNRDGIYFPFFRHLAMDQWQDLGPRVLQTGIGDWLAEQLGTKDYGQIALHQLDECMTRNRFRFSSRMRLFRRLLNRLNDHDLDEWLAQNHPAAYAFRQKEISRAGYDPADCLCEYLSLLEVWGELDTAISTIFPDKADQRGCRDLVEAMEGNGATSLDREGDWENRLRAWYWKNRDSISYSFEKHRFII